MVLPGSSIGRYLVKRKLAEGGMAELYLCTAMGPEGFEKEVVIKRIKAFLSSDQTFIDMFKAEARLASRLNHANVVQIFDFDRHEDAWFIAMEYVHGASLWELRRRCRELAVPFPPTLVAEIGAQTARGLHYAHTLTDKGKPLSLVHRDVTPHNVLLSFDGGVKLTDFGIAKAGTSFTAPGMLKGKFAYMSPEQARGERVDARTDVFALGITLWEMLTGGRLFEGDSDIAVLRAVQESLIAPPARLNPDVPTELSEIVLKALARPLEERYQSAHELDRALATFVLRNAASTEDSNVGLYLRQMFRDELEEAERALSAEHESGTESAQTPIVDAYALGNTLQVNRPHEPATQQTATPLPSSPPPPERPKTAQQPGIRQSRPFSPLKEDEQPASEPPREKTAQQPGLRISRRKLEPVEVLPATTPGRPIPVAEHSEAPPEAPLLPPPKSLLPWIVAACLAVGLVAGLGLAVSRRERAAEVIELPAEPVAAKVALAEAKPAESAELHLPAPEAGRSPTDAEAAEAVRPSGPLEHSADKKLSGAIAQLHPEAEIKGVVLPQQPAAKADPEAPRSASKPPEATAESAPKTAIARTKGTLLVEAIPYATLFINNTRWGDVQGATQIPLPPGVYGLRFEHPKRVVTAPATVKAGQKTEVVKFHPLEN
jgi:serine/threonine protein kinase